MITQKHINVNAGDDALLLGLIQKLCIAKHLNIKNTHNGKTPSNMDIWMVCISN